MLSFLFLIKRVKLLLKLKFNFPFWPIISKNIEKNWKNWDTLRHWKHWAIFQYINCETMKFDTMSMSIFSMFQCLSQCSMSICRPLVEIDEL